VAAGVCALLSSLQKAESVQKGEREDSAKFDSVSTVSVSVKRQVEIA
jgi:hypothetical protein